ncbi:hypothetical protein [Haladaptatus sp. AB643]|uniref:hypothetical protein n=1 Tax=Haladaptatus sp. AB643 TaxID=2934174 RepID=UPI00209BC680|nr:hypothetical protein [Haladaptatus sp. AB643]
MEYSNCLCPVNVLDERQQLGPSEETIDGQTTLSLYEYENPDALEDIIEASASKKSDVEV